MASAARSLGALLHRASSLSSSASALRGASLLRGDRPIGSAGLFQRHAARRRISSFPPLCMGRRSCKIAGRKDAQNLKKMKRNSKIGKEIVAAIKKGGPNPSSNTTLSAILEKARELDVPKEILERNIKRASEKGQDTYTEKVYEVLSAWRIFTGLWFWWSRFRQARVVNIKVTDADKDQLLTIALDAGADDVLEPNFDDDDSEEEAERFYKIVTTSENYPVVLSKLQEEGLKFETDNGYELLPLNPIEVDDEAIELNKELVSKLLELDDVDAVYTDQK
ncbi:probable transcriptional regulatory protein At2g25830 isoform X2 [Miscanthus floridulus]|uniref:probable transcriptional regulatory protein At2g25830 isoform X2 n=1 Tax=Miscanthus floridulus TaxID=154761 RepID=UPI00345AC5CB